MLGKALTVQKNFPAPWFIRDLPIATYRYLPVYIYTYINWALFGSTEIAQSGF